MRKTKIGFRRSDVYYFIYTAASNLSAQPCKSVRARQVPSARGVGRGVHYKCRGAGSRSLCKGAGELVLLLLRPTYLFCCKSQAATAKMLPLPFTLPPPFPLFSPSLPCLLAPCCTTTHATLHPVQTRFSFVLHAAWGEGCTARGESSGELALFMHTPPRPQPKQPAYAGHWRCRASPGRAGPGHPRIALAFAFLAVLRFLLLFSSPLFSSTFF